MPHHLQRTGILRVCCQSRAPITLIVFGIMLHCNRSFAQTADDNLNSEVYSVLSEAYERSDQGEPATGIALVTNFLQGNERSVDEELTARRSLIYLYQAAENFEASLHQIDLVIQMVNDPLDLSELCEEKAYCWDMLEDPVKARTFRNASQMYLQRANITAVGYTPQRSWRFLLDNFFRFDSPELLSLKWIRPVVYLGFWCMFWLLVSVVNVFVGRRQTREAKGTTSRLFFVAGAVAFMQCLPLLALSVILSFTTIADDIDATLWASLIALVTLVIWIGQVMLPPVRWCGSKESMKEVDDKGFLERLQQTSLAMQISPPVARVLPSMGVLSVQAFAGGMSAPSIAVSDGALLRLEPVERDAIVAHELGHIASGSLWWYPGVISVCGVATVLVTLQFSVWIAIAYGLALYAGLFRIVSRYFEYVCDRLAGQAVGYAEMVTALRKVHAASMIKNTGWKSFLAYCLATHPSLEERLSALTALAPEENKPVITWSEETARRRHVGSLIAGGLWVIIMLACLVQPGNRYAGLAQYIALMTVFLLPGYLLRGAIRDEVKQDAKRQLTQQKSTGIWFWLVMLLFGLSLGYLFGNQQDMTGELLSLILGLIGFFAGTFIVLLPINLILGKRNVNSKLVLALHQQRWEDALALGEKHARQIKKNADSQHSLILCRWLTGEREQALEDLETLKTTFPAFKQSWITEACLRSELHQHERVLELAREVMKDLKQDVTPHLLAARSLIHLGRLDEAEEELQIVEKRIPDLPSLPLIRAKIASDRQQPELVWQLLEKSHELTPGDPGVYVTEAEAEIRFGSKEKAETLLQQARKLLDAAPFTLYDWRYNQVLNLLNMSKQTPQDRVVAES